MREIDARPVFVTGLDRSGKTALRRFLVDHSAVWLSRRTELWSLHHGRYGDLADERSLARCLSTIGARPALAEVIADREGLERTFRAGPRNYGRLFGLILGQHAARMGKARWGEQDAELERFPDRVFDDYPAAVIVHLVRDPRSRYAALVRDAGRRVGGVGPATGAWVESVQRGDTNARRYAGRYLVLNAESFGRRGSRAEQALPEVLGIPGASLPGILGDTGHEWTLLPPSDVAFIEEHARTWMASYGYELSRPRLRPSQWLRHRAVDEPLGRLRLVARQARTRSAERGRSR
jgi:hypothetical protein